MDCVGAPDGTDNGGGLLNDGDDNDGGASRVGELVNDELLGLRGWGCACMPETANGIPTWSKAEKSMAVIVRANGAEIEFEMDVGDEMSNDSTDEGWIARLLRPTCPCGRSKVNFWSSVLPELILTSLMRSARTVISVAIVSSSFACISKYLFISMLALWI